jgi:hypothetical protein
MIMAAASKKPNLIHVFVLRQHQVSLGRKEIDQALGKNLIGGFLITRSVLPQV